jgi:NAD(P)-dependent dehydrogenase (short-subunit alcohol dehydrogenase family)
MAGRFTGRVAVVTGGVSGIGLAIARRLAAEGAKLAIWDRDQAALDGAAAKLGVAVHTECLDLVDAAAVMQAGVTTAQAMGRIDMLVASAGIAGPNAPTWEYPIADWQRIMDVNVNGVFYCNRSVVPHMLAGGWGRIVNIASIAGKEGNPNAVAYSASKAAVIGLTKSLGKELAGTDIRVNCVTPPRWPRRSSTRWRSRRSTSCCPRSRWGGSGRWMRWRRWCAGFAARRLAFLPGRCLIALAGGLRIKLESMFFFEKKNQKTFPTLG